MGEAIRAREASPCKKSDLLTVWVDIILEEISTLSQCDLKGFQTSGDNAVLYVAVDVRKAEFPAVVLVGQLLVVDAK